MSGRFEIYETTDTGVLIWIATTGKEQTAKSILELLPSGEIQDHGRVIFEKPRQEL